MKMPHLRFLGAYLSSTLLAAVACSNSASNGTCDSGSCAGSGASAGESAGGTEAAGGKVSKGGSSSGSAKGGTSAVGGSSASTAAGGTFVNSSAVGGAGGVATTGGATTGGATGSIGGTTSGGGSQAAGGASSARGGTTSSSTSSSAGGAVALGGSSSASSAVGGTASGGTSAVGGTASGGTSSTATTAPPPVLHPIAHYDFKDTSGITKVQDISGNGNHGTLSGAAFSVETEGRNDSAATFTGAADSLRLPADLFTSASGLTVSAWVFLTANTSGMRLFDFGSGPGNHIYLSMNNDASAMELGVQVGDGTLDTVTTPAMLPLNVWKHVTVMLSASGARIYVDGWLVASNTSMTQPPSALGATPNNWVGRSQIAGAAFAGLIDEFYVDDSPIDAVALQTRAWPKTDYSVWHFDEGTGTNVKDSSSNAKDGTLVHVTETATGWTPSGLSGGALRLTNDTEQTATTGMHVSLPAGMLQNCTSGMTIATWIKLVTNYSHMRVFDFAAPGGTSVATTPQIFGRTKGGSTVQWGFLTQTGPSTDAAEGPSLNWGAPYWTLGRWYHVAAVREGQSARIYVDGVQTLPTPASPTPGSPTLTLNAAKQPPSSLGATAIGRIGAPDDFPNSGGTCFNGAMDEFLLSCRAYTADEIKLLAARP